MRRDSLPPTLAADEDIREPNRDVVRNVAVCAPTMGASCDDRRLCKHSDTHIVHLNCCHAMDVGLEGVAQHVTTRRDSTIRSSGCPIWRDDAFDGRSISRHPRLGKPLMNLRKLLARLGHTLLDVRNGEQERRRREACQPDGPPRVPGNRSRDSAVMSLRSRVAVVGIS
jgi:hypothetical protein